MHGLINILEVASESVLSAVFAAAACVAAAVHVAGYGGDGHGSSNLQKEMTAAANRQQATDSALAEHISNIHGTISHQVSNNRHNAGSSSAATAAAGGLSVAACAALLAGPLAWLLRLLFSNDSLMDLGNRQELYRQGMKLLRCAQLLLLHCWFCLV